MLGSRIVRTGRRVWPREERRQRPIAPSRLQLHTTALSYLESRVVVLADPPFAHRGDLHLGAAAALDGRHRKSYGSVKRGV